MTPRVRLQIARSAPVIVVVLVLVGTAAFAGAWYTHEHPPTEAATAAVADEARFSASLDDAVTVQDARGLYQVGARLENPRPHDHRSGVVGIDRGDPAA
ncbi:MAG: hypothetical protein RI544_07815, partial [Haloquadratum sp.]|nr:hypothetical protein [Haloquadratum sp.]